MANYKETTITREFLDNNSHAYFIFEDNIDRQDHSDESQLRDHPHSIGFITKKFSDNKDESFYKPEEYASVFFEELLKLKILIQKRPSNMFYISKLGVKANRYKIWEKLIRHNLVRNLFDFDNVVFCWSDL